MTAGRLRFGVAAVIALAVLAPTGAGGSVADDPEPAEMTIGTVPQRGYDESDTKAMDAAGISSVRLWFPWAQVEPERGKFNWNMVDASVATNAKAGLTTLPFLFGTPSWAVRMDGLSCEPEACMSTAPRTDASRQAFAEFAAAAVRRYGPGGTFWREQRNLDAVPIETWQIWNEPNLSSFWGPAVDPAGYGALMLAAAPAIRGADPHARILLAGLSGTKTNDRRMSTADFMEGLYGVAGVTTTFDGIAIHPYSHTSRGTLGQVRDVRAIADSYGDDAGVWVTELGWASAGKRRWGLVKTRLGQARALGRALEGLDQNAERWGVRAVYWYAWRDTEPGAAVCGWCPWAGLIDRVGREKPAYEMLRAFALGDS